MATNFPEFRKIIADRRTELAAEKDALEGLATNKADLLDIGVGAILNDAIKRADTFTDASSRTDSIRSEIKQRLLNASPTSTVKNPMADFMRQALVLVGLGLKVDPNLPTQLLQSALDHFRQGCENQVQFAREAINALFVVNKVKTGQGRRVLSTDPSLETTRNFLENAKDAADRLKVTVSSQNAINEALLAGIKANLDAAIVTLAAPQTSELSRAADVTIALKDAVGAVASQEISLTGSVAGLLGFRKDYEERIAVANTDLTQIEAVSVGANELSAQIAAAQDQGLDVTAFVRGWATTLAVLSAIAKNTTLSAARSIFTANKPIADLYVSLTNSLKGVPGQDLSPLVRAADSLSALLVGIDKSDFATSQKNLLIAQLREGLVGAQDRARAWADIVDAHAFPTSLLLPKILDMLSRARLDRPIKALQEGNIAEFFSLTETDVAPTDRVARELQGTVDQESFVGEQIVAAFSVMQDRERNDTASAQDFENARDSSLVLVTQELEFLSRLEALLDQAGG